MKQRIWEAAVTTGQGMFSDAVDRRSVLAGPGTATVADPVAVAPYAVNMRAADDWPVADLANVADVPVASVTDTTIVSAKHQRKPICSGYHSSGVAGISYQSLRSWWVHPLKPPGRT